MRTNFAGFFLAVGMGLIVVLLGLGALSMAGLVSIMPAEEALAEQTIDGGIEPGTTRADSAAVLPTSTTVTPVAAGDMAAIGSGDALFKSNCAQCHAVNEKVVGPALAGITKRRSISWLVPWVQNSSKVIASGDEYAVKLFNDNGKQQMPSFGLSKKEIEDIMVWVNANEGTVAYAPQVNTP
jgi:mono/diheme cytochrome c family protein